MKHFIVITMAFILSASWLGCQQKGETVDKSGLDTDQKKISYALGQNVGSTFKQQGVKIEFDIFAQGVKDAYVDSTSLLTDEEIQQAFEMLQLTMAGPEAKAAKEEGENWLAENAEKEGVQTTESGLQYKVIEEGTGESPAQDSQVKVHYKGSLVNGQVFDSSYDRGEPAVFGVTQVIPGWTEALMMMKVGSKWELYIPSDLGYGARGSGQRIPPYSTLIFEVELLGIE